MMMSRGSSNRAVAETMQTRGKINQLQEAASLAGRGSSKRLRRAEHVIGWLLSEQSVAELSFFGRRCAKSMSRGGGQILYFYVPASS